MKIKLVFILFLLCNGLSLAQQPNFVQYSTNNGLSSSEIYDVIQDEWGYIWISSDHGLNRYDGYEFEHFSTEDGLTDNTVFRFTKDAYGRIWCTTYNNTLFLIDGQEPRFIPYKYNSVLQESAENKVLQDIFFDSEFNIYITLVVFDGYIKIDLEGKVENHITDDKECEIVISNFEIGARHNQFLALPSTFEFEEKATLIDSINLDAGEYNSLFHREVYHAKQKMTVFGLFDKVILKRSGRRSAVIDLNSELIDLGIFSHDLIWVSSWKGGVKIFDLKGNEKFHFLEGKSVSSLFVDHEGGLWIGTLLNGLYYYDNWKLQNLDPRNSTTPVSDLSYDEIGKLWVGYKDGEIYKRDRGSFEKFRDTEIIRPAHFYFNSETNKFYYSADHYLFCQGQIDSVHVGSINKFKVCSYNRGDSIVLGKSSGAATLLWDQNSMNPLISKTRVKDFETVGSVTYFATQSGLLQFKKGKSEHVSEIAVFQIRFNALAKSKDILIAASNGGGVVFYKESKYFLINKSAGLASDFVNTLCVENDSTLWVGTNVGISRLRSNNKSIEIKNIGVQNGLIDNNITAFVISGDTLWIGTDRGLTYLLKSEIDKPQLTTDYGLQLTSVEINDSTQIKSRLNLAYDQNRIRFNFVALSFRGGDQFDYRYKLKGLEENWSYTASKSVLYSSLDHGSYEFIVQYKGSNDSWNRQTASLIIEISPPYWQTAWFILTIIFIVGFFIYLFFKYKVVIYNGDVLREILRFLLKKLRRDRAFILIKEAGTEYKIYTDTILFISSDRNYLEIHTSEGKHLIREKIGNFLDLVPDPLEFLRIKRSYIIRIDQVTEKGKKYVKLGDLKLEVGETYSEKLEKIII